MDSPTTPSHVFISYAREDQPYTRKLADSLRQRGFEVWMDDRIDFGDRWWQTIVQAIRASAAIVVVMTPDSEQSEWVEREILLAQHEGKPIFPLLLRGYGIPLLVTTQYANVTGGRMPPDDFYERLEREVRTQSEEEIVAPLAPESTVLREWSWQQLRLPLAVVGLLAIGLLVGVVVSGLIGGGEGRTPIPTTSAALVAEGPTHTPRPATATSTAAPVVVDELPPTPTPSHTATSLPTDTDTPPPTPTPSHTATSLPTPTDTPNPTPTSSLTATSLPTSTPTPTPTSTLIVVRTLVREKDSMEMVYVPSGSFQMGSTNGLDDEQPVHSVTLDSFWIDRTEVTNAQYARCVAENVCSEPWVRRPLTRESYYGVDEFGNYPNIGMTWYGAYTYCQWAEGRLPTEAEWEYAARGPDGFIYPWGNDPPDAGLVNYNLNVGNTSEVGSYPDGASWIGAMDMAGNVWEWVADWYGEYPSEAQTNPKGPEMGDGKIIRGGSWWDGETNIRAARRIFRMPGQTLAELGFRCVVESGD